MALTSQSKENDSFDLGRNEERSRDEGNLLEKEKCVFLVVGGERSSPN